MTKIAEGLTIATVMIAAALAVTWGMAAGILDTDAPVRTVMVMNALLLAYYGNAIPKAVLRTPTARAGRRFAGWLFVLAGLGSAALWAFAPLDIATPVAMTVLASAVVLAFGYCRLGRQKSAVPN